MNEKNKRNFEDGPSPLAEEAGWIDALQQPRKEDCLNKNADHQTPPTSSVFLPKDAGTDD